MPRNFIDASVYFRSSINTNDEFIHLAFFFSCDDCYVAWLLRPRIIKYKQCTTATWHSYALESYHRVQECTLAPSPATYFESG